MRACLLLGMVLALGGCTGTRTSGADKGENQARGRSFVIENRLCVPEAWTVELPADRQAPVSERVGGCGNYVNEAAMEANTIPCGPCGFSFDPAVTRTARARMADACCYVVSSPPPPPRPSSAAAETDVRFACTSNGGCVASCRHGAVSRQWYEKTYPGGEACEDGCTGPGTEAPMCVDGSCVARRNGKPDPTCTRLDQPPLEGPGPAHACRRDAHCTNDCALGAVNAAWLSTQGDRGKCRDGCSAKGMEAPRCEDGACVAYRLGKRFPACTRKAMW